MMVCEMTIREFNKIVDHFAKKGFELDKTYSSFDKTIKFYKRLGGGWEKKVVYNLSDNTYTLENAWTGSIKRYKANLG